jgi:hypothetical protein
MTTLAQEESAGIDEAGAALDWLPHQRTGDGTDPAPSPGTHRQGELNDDERAELRS